MVCINMEDIKLEVDTYKILELLPHRYPFLLIDKVYICEAGKKGYGKKNVTINEAYFQGHFSERPIVPGVLIIESLAQTIAIVYNSVYLKDSKLQKMDLKNKVGYLASVNIKFLRVVRPGDTMYLEVELTNKLKNISSFDVKVLVDNKVIAKGNITVTEN